MAVNYLADYVRPDPHARIRELLDERNANRRFMAHLKVALPVLWAVTAVCFTVLGAALS